LELNTVMPIILHEARDAGVGPARENEIKRSNGESRD
jgi:hypothetical protein